MAFSLAQAAHHELVIKKSRFIACVEPVAGREEAQTRVAQLKAEHPDAAHVCWALLAGGRMPMTGSLPTPWYATQNIHLCTMGDFVDLCDELDVEIEAAAALADGKPAREINPRRFIENWRAESAIFLLSRRTRLDGSTPEDRRPAKPAASDLFG